MLEKLKSWLRDDALYMSALLLLVAAASFGLGRQSVLVGSFARAGGVTQGSELVARPPQAAAPQATTDSPTTIPVSADSSPVGEVVASKSGTKYHLPTCPGASQIKPANLISFASSAAAEAAGYTPAANCPGL